MKTPRKKTNYCGSHGLLLLLTFFFANVGANAADIPLAAGETLLGAQTSTSGTTATS